MIASNFKSHYRMSHRKTYGIVLLNAGNGTLRVKQAIPNFKAVCVLCSMLASLWEKFSQLCNIRLCVYSRKRSVNTCSDCSIISLRLKWLGNKNTWMYVAWIQQHWLYLPQAHHTHHPFTSPYWHAQSPVSYQCQCIRYIMYNYVTLSCFYSGLTMLPAAPQSRLSRVITSWR